MPLVPTFIELAIETLACTAQHRVCFSYNIVGNSMQRNNGRTSVTFSMTPRRSAAIERCALRAKFKYAGWNVLDILNSKYGHITEIKLHNIQRDNTHEP